MIKTKNLKYHNSILKYAKVLKCSILYFPKKQPLLFKIEDPFYITNFDNYNKKFIKFSCKLSSNQINSSLYSIENKKSDYNLSSKINKNIGQDVPFNIELKKLKTFIEVILSKDGEKDLDILDLKKYFYLCIRTKDYVDQNIIESDELKERITKIIHLNKSLKKSSELTKYLLFDIEIEINDYLFKLLLINSLLNIKTEDNEIESFYFLKDVRFNLLSVNPMIFIRSKFILSKLQSFVEKLIKNKNYLGIETIDLVILSNLLRKLFIDVSREEFFYHISKQVFLKDLNLHLEMLYTIDNIEMKSEYLFNVFQFLQFFINYKELLSTKSIEEGNTASYSLSFRDKVEIKKKFLELYTKLFLKILSKCQEKKDPIFHNNIENKNKKINIENDIIIRDKESLFFLNGENLKNEPNEVFIRKIINIPYYQIIEIMKTFRDNENLIDLAEHILNHKSLEKICSLDDMLSFIEFYLANKKINKFIVNFISLNAMEILRIGITRKNFEEKFILILGFICENSNVDKNLIYAVYEFFEEVKSILFHGMFLDCKTDKSDINSDSHFNSNISNEVFCTIKNFYLNMSNKIYHDPAFLNYLNNYINLSTCLNSIKI